MLTWPLFYTSILQLKKTSAVDIADPSGVVRSQGLESRDGALRIPMNGAENRKTLAGYCMAESFGSSIQRLAFASDDIFVPVAALLANGFAPLEIQGNYYDDVEARFGLEPALADRLCEENTLCDRDGDGEYAQVYSSNFGEGFFFEVVERRGRSSGYRTTNAPFRIAAQKRHLRPKGLPSHSEATGRNALGSKRYVRGPNKAEIWQGVCAMRQSPQRWWTWIPCEE